MCFQFTHWISSILCYHNIAQSPVTSRWFQDGRQACWGSTEDGGITTEKQCQVSCHNNRLFTNSSLRKPRKQGWFINSNVPKTIPDSNSILLFIHPWMRFEAVWTLLLILYHCRSNNINWIQEFTYIHLRKPKSYQKFVLFLKNLF